MNFSSNGRSPLHIAGKEPFTNNFAGFLRGAFNVGAILFWAAWLAFGLNGASTARAAIFTDNFDADTLGAAPSQWTTSDTWRVRTFGATTLACEEDVAAGTGRILTHPFTTALTQSWTVDFDYTWEWGGNATSNYGAYALCISMDMLNTSGNGYRVLVHQGRHTSTGTYDDDVIEILKVTGASSVVLAQGVGYDIPGWKTRGLSSPGALNHVRLSWDSALSKLTAYRTTAAGPEPVASATDSAVTSFSEIVFTATGFSATEEPQLDNVVVDQPGPLIWGVDGHPTVPEYTDLGAASQVSLAKELGCSYYRVDVRDTTNPYSVPAAEAPIDEMLPIATAQGLKLLPILYSPIDIFDPTLSPSDVYTACYNRGLQFAQKYLGQFDCVEIENELDGKCILPGNNGNSIADYDDSAPLYKFSRCKAAARGLADGVRAGDPTVKRAVGTAGWFHYGFVDGLLADGATFEVMVVHWYSNSGSITQAVAGWSSYGKPLWITEMDRYQGSYAGTEADQASAVERQACEMGNLPNVQAVFVYELLDEPRLASSSPTEAAYGLCALVRNAGNTAWVMDHQKQGFAAYQDIIAQMGSLAAPGDIIVDNSYLAPAVSLSDPAAWFFDDTDPGYFLDGYIDDDSTTKTGITARFYPYIPATGNYVVSVRYPDSTLNSAAVPVNVTSASGTATLTVNQQQNGGEWVVLGTYLFNAGEAGASGYVEIGNVGTTGQVTADAVKFHPQ